MIRYWHLIRVASPIWCCLTLVQLIILFYLITLQNIAVVKERSLSGQSSYLPERYHFVDVNETPLHVLNSLLHFLCMQHLMHKHISVHGLCFFFILNAHSTQIYMFRPRRMRSPSVLKLRNVWRILDSTCLLSTFYLILTRRKHLDKDHIRLEGSFLIT